MSERYLPEEWTLPEVTEVSRAFFTSGELRLQCCLHCDYVQHPPLDVCHRCQHFDFDYVAAPPEGVIDSFTVVHHPFNDLLTERVPFNVAVIALPAHPGVRIVGNVIDAEPEDLAIGRRVHAVWAHLEGNGDHDALALLQWALAPPPDAGADPGATPGGTERPAAQTGRW